MMKISIPINTCELEDEDLRLMCQLGVDCIDFSVGSSFPGVKEQGFPDLDQLLKLRRNIRSWGMDINRVTLPDLTEPYMNKEEGAEQQLANTVNALKVFGEAKVPIARLRFAGDSMPHTTKTYKAIHRGGAISRGERASDQTHYQWSQEETNRWWGQFHHAFTNLVPIADDHGIKLTIHPSDTPYPQTPFGGIGLHRVLDSFPSSNVGLVYCVGTRGEAGGTSLVLDEIHQFGRKGRIFLVHLRNVRGNLATTGAFEESMLDEGDLNIPKIMFALKKIGYSGCINPDHILRLNDGYDHSDHPNKQWRHNKAAWAYSIGYIKAIMAALDEYVG